MICSAIYGWLLRFGFSPLGHLQVIDQSDNRMLTVIQLSRFEAASDGRLRCHIEHNNATHNSDHRPEFPKRQGSIMSAASGIFPRRSRREDRKGQLSPWPLFRPQSQRTMTKEQSRNKLHVSKPKVSVLKLRICLHHNHKRDAVLI